MYIEGYSKRGISQFTHFTQGDDRLRMTIKGALFQKEYDKQKKYNRFLFGGIGDSIHGCWFLNSVDFTLKLNNDYECFRRPLFVDQDGAIQCGNPGCEDGYGFRPAMWVKI